MVLRSLVGHTRLLQVALAALSCGSEWGTHWVALGSLGMIVSGAMVEWLWVYSGSHSHSSPVAWSIVHTGLFYVAPLFYGPMMEQTQIALGHTVLVFLWPRMRHTLGCSRSPWQDCPGAWGGVNVSCSGLHSQNSLVGLIEAQAG